MQPKPNPQQAPRFERPVADLCASCVHTDDCHLRQMPTDAVHRCNEYDNGASMLGPDLGPLQSVPSAPTAEVKPESALLPGLCVNCDHREDCSLPKPVGGVWHCEEYQ